MIRGSVICVLLLAMLSSARACIWDSKTLSEEKHAHHRLADAIFNEPEPVNTREFTSRIAALKANPKRDDPAWWNDLAGGYIRLGQAAEAARLLESVTNRFAGDYGIHANLGTAYHLLGRYQAAEVEIARDLEINPQAHFGLEKYHLALLQYLSRGADYRLCHVYVDEFTEGFLGGRGDYVYPEMTANAPAPKLEVDKDIAEIRKLLISTNAAAQEDLGRLMELAAFKQGRPDYRTKWNLAADPKLEEGVAYMATLNSKEPACFVMLGVVANSGRNRNLAKAAFRKAIDLGSPQRVILEQQVVELNRYHPNRTPYILAGLLALIIVYCAIRIWMEARKRREGLERRALRAG